MPRVKNAEKRKKIIDQLLNKKERIFTRKIFLEKINAKLSLDEQIGESSLDKDIALINEEIDPRGVSIKWSHARGYHYTEEGFSLYKTEVNEDDKNLLLLASSVFSLFQGTPLQEKFSKLVNKVLKESVVGGHVHGLSELQLVQLGAGPAVKGSEWIPSLLDAILAKEPLEMIYQGIGKPKKKKNICPYLIKKYLNRWYLIAYDHNCTRPNKTSTFALDCIVSLDVSTKKYYFDPDFIPENFFRFCIGIWHFHDEDPIQVKLEFNNYIDEVLNAPLHHSQKTQLSKDGKKLTIQIEVYDTPELDMLIRSYGKSVKVIAPASLADRIRTESENISAQYR